MQKIQTNALANKIADRLTADTGGPMKAIDIALILMLIEILLPIIIDCFDPDDGEQVQQYLNKRYDSSQSSNRYGGYQRSTVRAAAREAKRAGRRSGRITWSQARATAIATFEEARLGDAQQLSLAIRENA